MSSVKRFYVGFNAIQFDGSNLESIKDFIEREKGINFNHNFEILKYDTSCLGLLYIGCIPIEINITDWVICKDSDIIAVTEDDIKDNYLSYNQLKEEILLEST